MGGGGEGEVLHRPSPSPLFGHPASTHVFGRAETQHDSSLPGPHVESYHDPASDDKLPFTGCYGSPGIPPEGDEPPS